LVARGEHPERVVQQVCVQLTALLGLRGARFEPGDGRARGLRLAADGALVWGALAWKLREHGFPVTTDVRMLAAPEHAVFVLREVLQYSRMNAARLLETSVANVDQLLEGARKRIGRTASAQQAITPE